MPPNKLAVPAPNTSTVRMLVVLDTLTPAERVAFVLHDTFAVSFEEIAPILGRSTGAARQLASRARRRVQGQGTDRDSDGLRQSKLVDAFLAAARKGDFHALLALLDPDVVLHADQAAVHLGAAEEIRRAPGVATFSRRAHGAKPALVNGAAGAVWMPGGRPRVVFVFTMPPGSTPSPKPGVRRRGGDIALPVDEHVNRTIGQELNGEPAIWHCAAT